MSRLLSQVTLTPPPPVHAATPPDVAPLDNRPTDSSGPINPLPSDASTDVAGPRLQQSRQQNSPTSDLDDRQTRRAQHMFEQGHARRAMQALSSVTALADLNTPEERDMLRALHPSAASGLPDLPESAPEIFVDLDWMAAEMTASNNGAAAGPSGYGSNYLAVLAADPHCVQAPASFIQQIVNNKLPEVLRDLLTTSIVVSIKKSTDGRRPIAIGDIFYRMAARYAQHKVAAPIHNMLRAHQYGTGHPDGCTQIVQSIQHLLRDPSCSVWDPVMRPMACISVDVRNAFNTIDRAAILRAL